MRMRLMLIVAALSIGSGSRAEPALLACYGKMKVLGPAGVGQSPEDYSLSISIDIGAKTIKVSSYPPMSLMVDPGDDTVAFITKPGSTEGVSTGGLNRVTGAVWMHILPPGGGLLGFDGVCKPAKKLF